MKKYILVGMITLILPVFVQAQTLKEACQEEKIDCSYIEKINTNSLPKIYLFRKAGCQYCRALMIYLSTLLNNGYNEKINIVVLEASLNQENHQLLQQMTSDFQGYPLLVIGEVQITGYNAKMASQIKRTIDQFLLVSTYPHQNHNNNITTITIILVSILLSGLICYFIIRKKPLQSY